MFSFGFCAEYQFEGNRGILSSQKYSTLCVFVCGIFRFVFVSCCKILLCSLRDDGMLWKVSLPFSRLDCVADDISKGSLSVFDGG